MKREKAVSVLIIDDNCQDARMLERCADRPLNVERCTDLQQGLDKLCDGQFDLVFLGNGTTAKEALERFNEQAVSPAQARGKFLANMSHQIRTSMNAIMGFCEVLGGEELPDEQRGYVEIISDSAQSLLEVINDILDLSKIEAGKLKTEIAECSLEKLLAVIESLMRPEAVSKSLKFDILQCSQLPANIKTDPVRLQQCLLNLISNAIKFTQAGHVYLNVSLQEDDGAMNIRFDIEDTGPGIEEEKQSLIFEEYMQSDVQMPRRIGTSGLGLAITKQLTDLLGGKLSFSSRPGKGSVFSLVLPAGVDVAKQPSFHKYDYVEEFDQQKIVKQAEREFSGSALVVEDNKNNQILIKLILERMGFDVTVAEDGRIAVENTSSRSFDIIFMDIQMPNMNGYDATRTMRRNGIKTPIVALTAYANK
ncbi:MAG: hybrid sensor histidine kinase/response regulator, partial [Planctomycetota bacterium]